MKSIDRHRARLPLGRTFIILPRDRPNLFVDAVWFTDSDHGWAVVDDPFTRVQTVQLVGTSDGGASWALHFHALGVLIAQSAPSATTPGPARRFVAVSTDHSDIARPEEHRPKCRVTMPWPGSHPLPTGEGCVVDSLSHGLSRADELIRYEQPYFST
jgi:hypothetical protein